MRLATCSFTEFRPEMGVPVRFTVAPPRWRLPYRLVGNAALIAPHRSMLALPKDAYTLAYRRRLAAAGVDAIRQQLDELAHGDADHPDQVVLLCFERLNQAAKGGGENWCHRSMFADWWREQTGEDVPELGACPAPAAAAIDPYPPATLFD